MKKRAVARRGPSADPEPTRDRLIAAAALEFAARGFDGATVDRIAARARLNKAMLYYHFHNKAALYRQILTGMFSALAERVEGIHREGVAPDEQIRRFVRAVADESAARPHFPPMWMREMAEGGRHLDEPVLAEAMRVLQVLGAILGEGRARGVFGPRHPFVVHMSIVAPIVLFGATAPIRARFGQLRPTGMPEVTRDQVVDYVAASTLSALMNSHTEKRGRR
jgi:AcrR family transcriptional regulator